MTRDLPLFTRRSGLALLGMSALGACMPRISDVNPVNKLNRDFRPIAFVSKPIPLKVERIVVSRTTRETAEELPIDADFVVPLEQIARLWPRQRLEAVGGGFDARYIIEDASAVARRNPDGGEVVLATIQVRIEVDTLYGVRDAETGARVESELRISGAPNIAERQEMLHSMAISMADKLDEQLTAAIAKNLQRQISPAARKAG